jgi:hypothetical protein
MPRRVPIGCTSRYITNRGTFNGAGYGGTAETLQLIRNMTR